MSEWEEARLADVCTKPQYGAAVSRSDGPGGPMFVRQTDITTGRIDWSSVPHCRLPDEDVPKYALRTGDLLISRLGNGVGNAATVQDPRGAVFAGYLIRFQVDPTHATPEFVGYQLQTPSWRAHVLGYRSGAAQPTMNARQMGDFRFQLPSLKEQRRIASVLGAFDDLIETNRELAGHLEDAVSAQFTSAGFDRTPTGASIPLGELIEVNPKLPKPSGEAPYVNMAALPTDSSRIASVDRRPATGGARFQNGDSLLARVTPCLENGKAAHVDVLSDGEVAVGSTEFLVLRDRGAAGSHWAYILSRSTRFRDYAMRHMSGSSGRQRCSADSVEQYPIDPPSPERVEAFRSFAEPAFKSIREIHEEIAHLTRTRDDLLPLLMSGKVRVEDVEIPKGAA